jgi:hypothetical protein
MRIWALSSLIALLGSLALPLHAAPPKADAPPLGEIAGVVRNSVTSAPVAGATVSAGADTARTDAVGHYTLSLPAGSGYNLTVSARGYSLATRSDLSVAEGQTTVADFSIDPVPGALQGTVRDAVTRAPVPGASVGLTGHSLLTDTEGAFVVNGLLTGDYTLTVTATGYQTATLEALTVFGGEIANTDIALLPLGTQGIRGALRDEETRAPVAGAVVLCGRLRATADASGWYALLAEPGTYEVGASAGGYWWSELQQAQVTSGTTLALDFVLRDIATPTAQFQDINADGALPSTVGVSWGDYDGDGRADLSLGLGGLFRNNGDLTFTKQGANSGLPTSAVYGINGHAWADFDNDGDLDQLVVGGTFQDTLLLRNDGDTFTDIAPTAGFATDEGGLTVSWGDYNRDGRLDVSVGYVFRPLRVYRNNANATFDEVTGALGITSPKTMGTCTWADCDNDGWLDLLTASDEGVPLLYHNDGGEALQLRTEAFSPSAVHAGAVAVADYDNDGWLDVAFGAQRQSEHGVLLYRNNGDGTFTDVTTAAGVTMGASWINTISWGDWDNDGWIDLYVGTTNGPVAAFHNNGNGTFSDLSLIAGLAVSIVTQASAAGDIEGDGRLDLFQASDPRSRVYHNVGPAANWLRVRALTSAIGDASNLSLPARDAIGARVEVNVDNDPHFPPGRTLARLINGGYGFMAQDEPVAQFGIPVAGPVAVRVIFVDGSVVVQKDVAVNRQLVVRDVLGMGDAAFIDITPYYWAYEAIGACARAGIVQGFWDGTYRPGDPVTRGQMAVYIARALAGGDASVPSAPATATFSDVDVDHWAFRYVEYCAGRTIVQGYWDGTSRPDVVVTRGQLAVYVARSVATPTGDAGVPDLLPASEPTFTDVPGTDRAWEWCWKYVEYCATEGIVQGYPDGNYHPEREVTRDQMAVYVARAFDLPL